MDTILEFIMEKMIFPLCIILSLVTLLGIPIGLYCYWEDSKSPTFELRKNESE